MPDLTPVDYQPDFGDQLAPPSPLQQQVAGFPQRAADLAINALGPLGEAGMTVGDWLRTGGSSFDTRDIAPVAAGVMLGTAAPEAEEETAAADAAQAVAKGIRAYHGSPYDFDKFDLSKIGTGEGAQAYGHGLYFAENPEVAERYKSELTPSYYYEAGRQLDAAEQNAASLLIDYGMSKQEALDYIDKNLRPSRMSDQQYLDQTAAAVQRLDPAAITKEARGRTYEVNIAADPEHFLDWDKPLSEQSPQVKSAVDKALGGWQIPEYADSTNGANITRFLGGGDKAAVKLRQAGIPGIRYLDQGSRAQKYWVLRHPEGGTFEFPSEAEANAFQSRNPEYAMEAPKQTHNYVVFDSNLIDIIKKYGLAGLIAGGAAHFSTSPVDYQPEFTQ